jgi:Flp pilus assembly protein TadD
VTSLSDSLAEPQRLMQAGRFTEARAIAERIVEGLSVCTPAHGQLALILLNLGSPAEADAEVNRAMRLQPGSADAYDALAYVRSNAPYRRTVELAPNDPRFWYNLASSERSFGRLIDAESACDRAIGLQSGKTAKPSLFISFLLLENGRRVSVTGTGHRRLGRIRGHRYPMSVTRHPVWER